MIELAPLLLQLFQKVRHSGPQLSDGCVQRINQILDHALFLCLVIVEREAVVFKSDILKSSVDHAERCHLLGDKQYLPAARQRVGNDIGDRLALSCAGRPLQHETDSVPGQSDGVLLAGVRIHDQIRFATGNTVVVKLSPLGPDRRQT